MLNAAWPGWFLLKDFYIKTLVGHKIYLVVLEVLRYQLNLNGQDTSRPAPSLSHPHTPGLDSEINELEYEGQTRTVAFQSQTVYSPGHNTNITIHHITISQYHSTNYTLSDHLER